MHSPQVVAAAADQVGCCKANNVHLQVHTIQSHKCICSTPLRGDPTKQLRMHLHAATASLTRQSLAPHVLHSAVHFCTAARAQIHCLVRHICSRRRRCMSCSALLSQQQCSTRLERVCSLLLPASPGLTPSTTVSCLGAQHTTHPDRLPHFNRGRLRMLTPR